MTDRAPDLSVVVPSVNGWEELRGSLSALRAQTGDVRLEIVVPERVGPEVREPLARSCPEVRVIELAPGTTIPHMRAKGFELARAPVVGVIEDHVIVPADWATRMLEAHGQGAEVVGGSVENGATERWSDWAAFLCEYSHCLDPKAGPAEWLTGNNVTYRRELLERYRRVILEGGWENRLHDALRADGITLLCRPDIRVLHDKHFSVRGYLEQRYLYSRAYAGARVEGCGAITRLGYAAGALLLPPVLALRIISGVRKSGRYGAELIRSLPLLPIFVGSWALGELVGSVAGPGDALGRVC
ncbi:MAG: glycosyltransferase family 2 protein [Gemmatimonadota bacterium]